MIIILLLLFVSMFVGGFYMLLKKLLSLKHMQVVKGTIVDWKKQMDTGMVIKYVPVVQYMDIRKNALQHEVLKIQSSGFRLKPSAKDGEFEYHVVRLTIDKHGEARFLFDVVADMMIPAGYILLGLILSLNMLQEL